MLERISFCISVAPARFPKRWISFAESETVCYYLIY